MRAEHGDSNTCCTCHAVEQGSEEAGRSGHRLMHTSPAAGSAGAFGSNCGSLAQAASAAIAAAVLRPALRLLACAWCSSCCRRVGGNDARVGTCSSSSNSSGSSSSSSGSSGRTNSGSLRESCSMLVPPSSTWQGTRGPQPVCWVGAVLCWSSRGAAPFFGVPTDLVQAPHRLVLLLQPRVLENLVGAQHLANLDLPPARSEGGSAARSVRARPTRAPPPGPPVLAAPRACRPDPRDVSARFATRRQPNKVLPSGCESNRHAS